MILVHGDLLALGSMPVQRLKPPSSNFSKGGRENNWLSYRSIGFPER
jgi:hypothetical protein